MELLNAVILTGSRPETVCCSRSVSSQAVERRRARFLAAQWVLLADFEKDSTANQVDKTEAQHDGRPVHVILRSGSSRRVCSEWERSACAGG